VALDVERAVLRIDGNREGLATRFPHLEHQERLGGKQSCASCHHLSLPQDHSTPCSRCHADMERATPLFVHQQHFRAVARREELRRWIPSNYSCSNCHAEGRTRGRESAKPCLDCHREDMAPTREIEAPLGLERALGYRAALHGTCIGCHRTERERVNRPALADCATCHPAQPLPEPEDASRFAWLR
jgi:hypothetical protein